MRSKRGKRITLLIIFVGCLVGLLLVWFLVTYVAVQIEIDQCLDRGGRWDYEKNECVLEQGDKGGEARGQAGKDVTSESLRQ